MIPDRHSGPRPHPADRPGTGEGPAVCELVGLPGAGKTATTARIVEQLRARGVRCGDRRSLGAVVAGQGFSRLRTLGFHVTHPRHLLSAVRLGASVRPFAAISLPRAYRVASWSVALRHVGRSGFDPVILDQGIVQEIWSLTLDGACWSRSLIEAVVRGLQGDGGLSPMLVYLDVGIDAALKRIRQRLPTNSRFDNLRLPEARRLLTEREARLRQIFDQVVSATGTRWCRIDGEQPLDESCAEVIAFWESASGAHPPPAHGSTPPPMVLR